jgi:hypothetical protein
LQSMATPSTTMRKSRKLLVVRPAAVREVSETMTPSVVA